MADNWQIGDLAEMLGSGTWKPVGAQDYFGPHPVVGGVYMVTDTLVHGADLYLSFAQFDGSDYHSKRFRKIRPSFEEPRVEHHRITRKQGVDA